MSLYLTKVEDFEATGFRQMDAAIEITLSVSPRAKTWLAEILGLDQTYGLDRQFIAATHWDVRRSGRGEAVYLVGDGLYESNEDHRYGRRFWLVDGGQVTELTRQEALQFLH